MPNLKAAKTADEVLAEELAILKRRQTERLEHLQALRSLCELRDLEIRNIEARLAQSKGQDDNE